ncbi:MAG TPA: c-type cytochrome [Longimicrobium sp.]
MRGSVGEGENRDASRGSRSPFPAPRSPLFLALLCAVTLAACKRHEKNPEAWHVTQSQDVRDTAQRVRPGPGKPGPEVFRDRALSVKNPYEGDAKAIQEGRRLYRWMNCKGCHGEGGGGIGPTLWDDQWRYGGRGVDIAESILYGRPDGMPAFAGHIPEDQVWRIVAYVQSLEPRGGPYHAGVK